MASESQQFQSDQESEVRNGDDCLFCMKFGTLPFKKIDFGPLLNRALASKYATKQAKSNNDINQLIENRPVKWVIDLKDEINYEEEEEYLKRYYPRKDLQYKMESLLEYFKYHKDIPRLFMRRLGNIAVDYFERQKHITYKKIKRMLGIPVRDHTEHDTHRENSKQVEKIKQLMVLEGVSLSLRRTPNLQDSHQSSKSILNLMLHNADYQAVNISETWMSMSQAPKIIQVPTGSPKNADRQASRIMAEQNERVRVQGLLQVKSQMGGSTKKLQIKHKKEQQEQLIKQLIHEGCMKKSLTTQNQGNIYGSAKTQRPLNMVTAFNSSTHSSQLSPTNQTRAQNLLFTITQVPKSQQQIQQPPNMIRTLKQHEEPTSKILTSGRTELPSQSSFKIIKNESPKPKPSKFSKVNSQGSSVRASLADIQQNYTVGKKFSTVPWQGINLRSKSFETIKNLSMLNSLYTQQKRVDTFQEELRARQIMQNMQQSQSHRKSQTQYSEPSHSPSPHTKSKNTHPAVSKLSQIVSDRQLKPNYKPQKSYQSQPSINININQLNMNHVNVHQSEKNVAPNKQSSQSMHHIKGKADFQNSYHLNKVTKNSFGNPNVSQKSTKIYSSKLTLRQI